MGVVVSSRAGSTVGLEVGATIGEEVGGTVTKVGERSNNYQKGLAQLGVFGDRVGTVDGVSVCLYK